MSYSDVTIAMLIMEFISFTVLLTLLVIDWILDVYFLELVVIYMTCLFAVETIVIATTCLRLLTATVHTDLLY